MQRKGSNPTEDALKKKFSKPLDKRLEKCYNKGVPRETPRQQKGLISIMKKITYIEALNTVLTTCELSDEVREKLTALRDQQTKRNAVDKKPTKNQAENEELKSHILDVLTALGKPATVTDIMNAIPILKDKNNQKVTALVTAMYNKGEGCLNRELIQRKAHFSIKA